MLGFTDTTAPHHTTALGCGEVWRGKGPISNYTLEGISLAEGGEKGCGWAAEAKFFVLGVFASADGAPQAGAVDRGCF